MINILMEAFGALTIRNGCRDGEEKDQSKVTVYRESSWAQLGYLNTPSEESL